jgi:hypothetical protein
MADSADAAILEPSQVSRTSADRIARSTGFTLNVLEYEHNAVFVVYRREIRLALVDRPDWRPMRTPAPVLPRMEVVA